MSRNTTTTRQAPFPMDWFFWLKWVLATFGGWLAGWIITIPLNLGSAMLIGWVFEQGWDIAPVVSLSSILFIAVTGTVIGILQWLVLRQRLPVSGLWWVLATATGFTISVVPSMFSTLAASPTSVGLAIGAFTGLVTGVIVGAMQWLVLRRHLPQAGWWVLASASGWVVCWVFTPLAIIMSAGLTGFTLLWLLWKSHPVS